MHDLVLVRSPQRARYLDRVGERLGDLERPLAPDQLLKRLSFDVLEHDVRSSDTVELAVVASLLLPRVDDPDDVRMLQLRDRARLAAKALELVGVGRDLAVHELDRDGAFEHRVEGPVHGRHASAADARVEPVAPAEQGADRRHGIHCALTADAGYSRLREPMALEAARDAAAVRRAARARRSTADASSRR